jgi:hypothetical protein
MSLWNDKDLAHLAGSRIVNESLEQSDTYETSWGSFCKACATRGILPKTLRAPAPVIPPGVLPPQVGPWAPFVGASNACA